MNNNITCVIAAYNEEERIGNVLKAVSQQPLIKEIIVVDDGSLDNTSGAVRQFKKVKLISYKKNKGKTLALLTGISKAKGDYIVLVDSDLTGLNTRNLSDLITPLTTGKAEVSIGLRSKKRLSYNFLDLLVLLSGERAFKNGAIDFNRFRDSPGYGFESLFNLEVIKKKMKVKFVPLPNVENTVKMEKVGFFKGLIKETGMGLHILKAVGFSGCIRQMLFLRSLSVD